MAVVDLNGPLQVNTKVPEAQIDKVVRGMKAKIRVDALPDHLLDGTIIDVAVLPDPLGFLADPSPKVYTTVVRIDNRLPALHPGMTAQVEILVNEHGDVKQEKPGASTKPNSPR